MNYIEKESGEDPRIKKTRSIYKKGIKFFCNKLNYSKKIKVYTVKNGKRGAIRDLNLLWICLLLAMLHSVNYFFKTEMDNRKYIFIHN